MSGLGFSFDLVLHSPWLRAVQTAEMLVPLTEGELRSEAGLAMPPEASTCAELAGSRVAVVGHEPWLTELMALLCFGSMDAADGLQLKKGGVAWLEGEPRPAGMVLRAFLPPRLFRGAHAQAEGSGAQGVS